MMEYKFIRTGRDVDVHKAAKSGWKVISIQWQTPRYYDDNLSDVEGDWACIVMERENDNK